MQVPLVEVLVLLSVSYKYLPLAVPSLAVKGRAMVDWPLLSVLLFLLV